MGNRPTQEGTGCRIPPHELKEEFPSHVEKMQALKAKDAHFAKLYDDYHEINLKVYKAEAKIDPTDEETRRTAAPHADAVEGRDLASAEQGGLTRRLGALPGGGLSLRAGHPPRSR